MCTTAKKVKYTVKFRQTVQNVTFFTLTVFFLVSMVRNISFFVLSFPQNERKMYERDVFTFQFLNDTIHNNVPF